MYIDTGHGTKVEFCTKGGWFLATDISHKDAKKGNGRNDLLWGLTQRVRGDGRGGSRLLVKIKIVVRYSDILNFDFLISDLPNTAI